MCTKFYFDNDNKKIKKDSLSKEDVDKIMLAHDDLTNVLHFLSLSDIVTFNSESLKWFVADFKTDSIYKHDLFTMANSYFLNFYNSFSTYNNFIRSHFSGVIKKEFDLEELYSNDFVYNIMLETRNYAVHKDVGLTEYIQSKSDFKIPIKKIIKSTKQNKACKLKAMFNDQTAISDDIELSDFYIMSVEKFQKIDYEIRFALAKTVILKHLCRLFSFTITEKADYKSTFFKYQNETVSINEPLDYFVSYIRAFMNKEDPIYDWVHWLTSSQKYYGCTSNINAKSNDVVSIDK